jgi:quercetin dioxygenase-like cupin family protein
MTADAMPQVLRRTSGDLPFAIAQGAGPEWKARSGKTEWSVVHVDPARDMWVIHGIYEPGARGPRHRHTGPVLGFTVRGAWTYLEQGQLYEAGSYIFEPAGSLHTFHVPVSVSETTEAWFAIFGSIIGIGDDGEETFENNWASALEQYRTQCAEQHLPAPDVLIS